jgi:uroporphyrinogen-III synthase
MAVLVTRPHPDNEATARALRDRGFAAALAPMLRFEPVALARDLEGFGAVVVTSANALRAVEAQLAPLLQLPLFAVGEHTAAEAKRRGRTLARSRRRRFRRHHSHHLSHGGGTKIAARDSRRFCRK